LISTRHESLPESTPSNRCPLESYVSVLVVEVASSNFHSPASPAGTSLSSTPSIPGTERTVVPEETRKYGAADPFASE